MGIVNDTMCSLLEERVYFVDFWQGAVLQGRYRLDGELTYRDAMGALIGMSKLKEFKHENGGVDMCKAFEEEREEGRLEGIEQTLADNLRNIIKKLGYSAEQALQLLMVPEEEWSKYKELI